MGPESKVLDICDLNWMILRRIKEIGMSIYDGMIWNEMFELVL